MFLEQEKFLQLLEDNFAKIILNPFQIISSTRETGADYPNILLGKQRKKWNVIYYQFGPSSNNRIYGD